MLLQIVKQKFNIHKFLLIQSEQHLQFTFYLFISQI